MTTSGIPRSERVISVAIGVLAIILATSVSGWAQPPSQPFAPGWAMLAGWNVHAAKGCGKCHAVRGVGGGGGGPDLGRIGTGTSFFEIGAAMWNHLPRMGARMREVGVERPQLSALQASNLIAFLFTAQYFDESGDAKRGEPIFTAKGCVNCHAVGGRGGLVGPRLDGLRRVNSPVLVAAAMWNHAPQMGEAFEATGIARPMFEGQEMLDLIAFFVKVGGDSRGETEQVVPGTPDRGRGFFAEKKCATCHAVGGKGPQIGPDLGRAGHHISLTEFAARMWNHAPAMTTKMKELKIAAPKVSGQEMADILAFLYTARYFEGTPTPRRGGELLQSKGCLGCHAVGGKGAKVGGDLARSGVVGSPGAFIAAMWNHSRLMEIQAEKRQVAWPEFSGADMADVAAYLASLSRGDKTPSR